MAAKKNELTKGEWIILTALWDNEPCAAPTIQEQLTEITGWSYSTVKTMMDRMVSKGILKTERIRNLILYSSAVTKRQAQKTEMFGVMKRAFDGALTPMMQFLIDNNNLSKDQLGELEAIIKDKKKKAKK